MTKTRSYQPRTAEVVFWLLCLFPVGLIALWRSGWPQRLKIGLMAAIAIGAICLIAVQAIKTTEEAARVAAAPHVTADDLTSAYKQGKGAAGRRFDHKRLVVTGTVGGMDEGLFGDGCIHMGEAVICDVGGHFGSATFGQQATIIGMCEGRDAYGAIWISNAYVLKP